MILKDIADKYSKKLGETIDEGKTMLASGKENVEKKLSEVFTKEPPLLDIEHLPVEDGTIWMIIHKLNEVIDRVNELSKSGRVFSMKDLK